MSATACSSWGQNSIVMALNIALIGYGKMGREIEAVALQRGHHIAARVGREGMGAHTFSDVDVAIEFTQPDAAFANVHALLAQGIPTVCGTTGWFGRVPELDCTQTPLVYASNFSLGVNIAFQVNRYLAKLIAPHSDYRADMEEIHHTAKKDAPSGTAITLAEGILAANPSLNGWALQPGAPEDALPIAAIRKDPVPGTHTVTYRSAVDQLSLTHVAHSRAGFALGAVVAAERIQALHAGSHTFASLLFPEAD